MKYYVKGDSINLEHQRNGMTSCISGEILYTDKEHLIVRFEFSSEQDANDFKRESMSYEDVQHIIGSEISTLKISKHDILLDMKAPHIYLRKNTYANRHAPIHVKDIFWENVVLDEPVNGYTIVKKDGKYNFINPDTDDYLSDIWFDRAINWVTRKGNAEDTISETYTIVEHNNCCYKINKNEYADGSDYLLVTKLSPRKFSNNFGSFRHSNDFKGIFGVKLRTLKDIVDKTVCKIDDRWYLASSLIIPWGRKMETIYYQRDKNATIKLDRQWWYFLYTTMACPELCIGETQGKYGLFPLMEHKGIQHAAYYVDGYPFIYDSVKVYDSHTVHHGQYSENAHGYIAVNEKGKWGLFKITGLPTMKLERIAESIFSSPIEIFTELGIQLPEEQEGPDLREDTNF